VNEKKMPIYYDYVIDTLVANDFHSIGYTVLYYWNLPYALHEKYDDG